MKTQTQTHTPGPWMVGSDPSSVTDQWGNEIAKTARYGVDILPQGAESVKSAAFPNARLIAAAPELLEAVKQAKADVIQVMEWLYSTRTSDDKFRHIGNLFDAKTNCERAITKATGGQQ